MSDEIDIETRRLERLNAQKQKRLNELMSVDVEHKDVHTQTTPTLIFKKVKKNEA